MTLIASTRWLRSIGIRDAALGSARKCCFSVVLTGVGIITRDCPAHPSISRLLTAADHEVHRVLRTVPAYEVEALKRRILLEAFDLTAHGLAASAAGVPVLSHTSAAQVLGLAFAVPAEPVVEAQREGRRFTNRRLRLHPLAAPELHRVRAPARGLLRPGALSGAEPDEPDVHLPEGFIPLPGSAPGTVRPARYRAVTSVPWTVLDVALEHGLDLGFPMAEDALHRGLLTPAELREAQDLHPHGHRRRALRLLVELASAVSESAGESLTKLRLHQIGHLARFEQQVEVYDEEGFIARLDFADSGSRTAVEFDGHEKYHLAGDPHAALRRQWRKEQRLRKLRWSVHRVEWAELFDLDRFIAAVL